MRSLNSMPAAIGSVLVGYAHADATDFSAMINGAQQVPDPVVTDAVGTLTGTYDSDLNSFSFSWAISGDLVGDPSSPGAHLHSGAAGTNGPVVFGFNNPDGTWELSGSSTWTSLSTGDVDALFAGEIYVNFHTTSFPGGEIRGQINIVPSPSGMGLLAMVGVGGSFRRRRQPG